MASYGSDNGLATWLTDRGHTLPAGALASAILRQRASDHIDATYGVRLVGDQAVAPLLTALENATYAAAWHEANNPGSLSVAASAAGAIKRERVDVIETEYFEGSGDASADATVRLSLVEGILAPYLRQIGVTGPLIYSIG